MEERDLNQILAGKQRRRHELARLPIEKKLLAVVRLQEMAAPILRQRGKTVRCWSAGQFTLAEDLRRYREEQENAALVLREKSPGYGGSK
jgi:hypothetical protein